MKKIDLHISRYGEITLVTNPDLGNYVINTIQLTEDNINNFIEEIKRIIPYWFKSEPIDNNSIKIIYNDFSFSLTCKIEDYKKKKKLTIFNDKTPIKSIFLKEPINTYKLFSQIFTTVSEDYFIELRVKDLLSTFIEKMNHDLYNSIKVKKYNTKYEYFNYINEKIVFVLELKKETTPFYSSGERYVFSVNLDDNSIKFIGELLDTEYGDELRTISSIEQSIISKTNRLNKIKNIKELLET